MPRIFYVNWFRKSADGRFLWPGFGDNSRVLQWIFERLEGTVQAKETPIGLLPEPETLNLKGLNISRSDLETLLRVDTQEWEREITNVREHFALFGKHLPTELNDELAALENRLQKTRQVSSPFAPPKTL